MNQTIFREQLLRQEGLAGGYVPANVKQRIATEVRKRKVIHGLVMGAMALSFVMAVIVFKLPENTWVQHHIFRQPEKFLGFRQDIPVERFHYGALALLGVSLLILSGVILRKWMLGRRLAGIQTSLGNPRKVLREARTRK